MEEKSERISQPKEAEISRRDLLRKIAISGTSLTALFASLTEGTGVLYLGKKERYLAKSPEGYKIGMVMGVHGMSDSSSSETTPIIEMTPIKEKELYSPVGAIFLEIIGPEVNYLDPEVQATFPVLFQKVSQKRGAFSQEPIKYALENNIPIILGDIVLKDVSTGDLLKIAVLPSFLTTTSFLVANTGLALESIFKEKLSRRGFLKLLSVGGTLGAVHFSSRATVEIMRKLRVRPKTEVGRDFQAVLSDINHPEDFIVVMQNIVWALKGCDFYERDEIPKDKILNVIGGAGHQFFDFFVRHPEIARKYWYLFGYKKVAAKFSGGDPSWVYKSYIFDPETGKGRVVTHESLKELVA